VPEKVSTRDRLVTATAELMRRQGYSATSVKQISVAAHAPIGSLYHHFPEGKPQIAAAALRTSGAAYAELLPLLLDEHDDLRAAVPAAFAAAADTIEQADGLNMGPVAPVAGEIADSEPALRAVAAEVVGDWITRGTAYFTHRGLGEPEARELTLAVLSTLEGAFVLSRTLRSAEPLHAAGRALAARIDAVLAPGRLGS
jgi:AcrR family transcriptional regulator